MRIKPVFKLRTIAGETIVVHQGTPDVDMTRIISLKASARLLWERLAGREFGLEDAAAVLEETYQLPAGQAEQDAAGWVEALQRCGVLTTTTDHRV